MLLETFLNVPGVKGSNHAVLFVSTEPEPQQLPGEPGLVPSERGGCVLTLRRKRRVANQADLCL